MWMDIIVAENAQPWIGHLAKKMENPEFRVFNSRNMIVADGACAQRRTHVVQTLVCQAVGTCPARLPENSFRMQLVRNFDLPGLQQFFAEGGSKFAYLAFRHIASHSRWNRNERHRSRLTGCGTVQAKEDEK